MFCSLCEGGTSICTGRIPKNCQNSYCFRLALLHSVTFFIFLYRSPFLSLCMVVDAISTNIDVVFSINPPANVFVFKEFHHKDWLTYSGGTYRFVEHCYIFYLKQTYSNC